jgi:hypothetical protein
MGSEICANEMRRDALRLAMDVAVAVREAAKGGSFPTIRV